MDLKFYRKSSVLGLSTWDEKQRVMLEVSPTMPGAPGGQPEAGSKRYDYDKSVRISFTVDEMLTASYILTGMSHGVEGLELKKFADMSKSSAEGDEKKSLTVQASQNGGFFVGMAAGANKVNIILNPEEIYAIGRYLEFCAQKYITADRPSYAATENA